MGSFLDVPEVRPKLGEDTVRWPEDWLTEGEARGLDRGRRCIPRCEAKARFGTGTATELANHFDWVSSPEAFGGSPLDYLGQAPRQVRKGDRGFRSSN